jgi:hypothetical protein
LRVKKFIYDNARVKDWSRLPCSAESLTPVCRGHAQTNKSVLVLFKPEVLMFKF